MVRAQKYGRSRDGSEWCRLLVEALWALCAGGWRVRARLCVRWRHLLLKIPRRKVLLQQPVRETCSALMRRVQEQGELLPYRGHRVHHDRHVDANARQPSPRARRLRPQLRDCLHLTGAMAVFVAKSGVRFISAVAGVARPRRRAGWRRARECFGNLCGRGHPSCIYTTTLANGLTTRMHSE